jgi:hypothetical protein
MQAKPLKFSALALSALVLAACGKPNTEEKNAELGGSVAVTAKKPVEKAAIKNYDGPFGLTGSIPVAELSKLGFKESESSPGVFLGKPPKPMDDINDYYVFATPAVGVCRIRATYDVPTVNDSGDQLKAKVDQFAEMMAVRYGKHSDKVTYISRDVYRRNPEFWMMALREESVYYAYDWTVNKTEKPLPGDMTNIEVSANATSSGKGYVSIQYTYKNFEACKEELKKKSAANL